MASGPRPSGYPTPAPAERALPAAVGAGPSTCCVHAGETVDPHGSVGLPVVHASTFWYPELPSGAPSAHIYSRQNNPTVQAVEAKLAALEGTPRALLFGSGMAAIHAACAELLAPGNTIAVQRGVYGGMAAYLLDELVPYGVRVHPFDAHADGSLPAGTRLVWIESVTNPLLRVADVAAWAERAHDAGALLAVDATFATPLLQRPRELGADLVMHSATKYLGGHSDLLAGALCGDEALIQRLWRRRRNLGGILDPHAAFLLGRGMKTLALRLERHNANAMAVARAGQGHPAVAAVHYPGLPDHPDHALARRVLDGGFGGMVTLDLGTLEAAKAFRRAVRLFTPAASLGGVESLVSLPLETSHAYATAESRRADGITDGLVRLSVGIEDADDLVADLTGALDAARAVP